MKNKELQALAILTGGQVVKGKVYVAEPERVHKEGKMCTGCAFEVDGTLPARGTRNRVYCDMFTNCVGLIRVELKS